VKYYKTCYDKLGLEQWFWFSTIVMRTARGSPKHLLCGPQSFYKTSNILCNRLRSAIK